MSSLAHTSARKHALTIAKRRDKEKEKKDRDRERGGEEGCVSPRRERTGQKEGNSDTDSCRVCRAVPFVFAMLFTMMPLSMLLKVSELAV